ncbi:LOW QUALITY PROTEIN: hypothetical protein CFOL_v3_30918, partial [Cephalotus follicularis]
NHENRSTGSAPLPEVNATSSHFGGRGSGRGRGKGNCNRCGLEGHWYRACRTTKYWVNLYTYLKEKDKRIETNFIGHCDPLQTMQSDFVLMGITHLDIADFITDPNEKMN